MRRQALWLALAFALCAGCAGRVRPADVPQRGPRVADAPRAGEAVEAGLVRLVDAYWERQLALNPSLATFTGDHRYDDRLENTISPGYLRAARSLEEEFLGRALLVDRAALGERARLTLDIFLRDRRIALEGFEYPEELLPLNQFWSRVNEFAQMGGGAGVHPFATERDYRNWLSRIHDFVAWADQAVVNLRQGVERGIVLPRVVVERVVPQLDALVAADPLQSGFYDPVRRMPASIRGAARERLAESFRIAIRAEIDPALRRLRDYLRREYLPRARVSVGLSSLPGGGDWYRWRVRQYTTTDLAPDAIHALGLGEVARIRENMVRIMREVGFRGELRDFLDALRSDPRFQCRSPEELLEGYRSLQRTVETQMPRLFAIAPRARLEVRPIEPFRERSAASAEYQSGTPDGSRPGVFYVNTYDLPSRPTYVMQSTFLHEALPGHHFQLSLQNEDESLPRFRRHGGYTAYFEGWAMYAETLGAELGLQTDPYDRFGALSDEALRAARLVVDTGLHTRGWTREQAIDYLLASTALGTADAVAEIERYIAVPGQALGYKLGQLEFLELRDRAARRLGNRFDLRELHTQFLNEGALPLDVLEQKIDVWIEARAAAP